MRLVPAAGPLRIAVLALPGAQILDVVGPAEVFSMATSRRVVEQGKIITAAGVSSGIDMALHLAARIAGEDFAQSIRLGIEYDPEPPFSSGSPHKAPAHVLAMVRERMKGRLEPTR